MANQTVTSFHTLPVELVYRILDQQSDLTILCSMRNTLTTLNLGWNEIGDQGAQDLANALQINKVTTILVSASSSLHFIIHILFTQTLTTLDIAGNQIGAKGAQDLANALQINKVTTILVSLPLHSTSTSTLFTQTLTTLNIGANQIGDQGAQDLANALQINKVTTILVSASSSLHFIIHILFTQTLTTLNLDFNQIGIQGAQDLANALQINKVTTILVLRPLHFISSFTYFLHRHSRRSTFVTITSIMIQRIDLRKYA
ncbi:unnamed protein product [Adineta steineri]|uniref:RNI-like protein n=1 Tax=Adineta steineri TaxID=433720 RepID=A0A813PPH0_9BILA|nr:unnamed protein product [Adineta steineri]